MSLSIIREIEDLGKAIEARWYEMKLCLKWPELITPDNVFRKGHIPEEMFYAGMRPRYLDAHQELFTCMTQLRGLKSDLELLQRHS